MNADADAFIQQNTEEYQAAREFVAKASRLAGYISECNQDLSAQLDKAATELALRTGATADTSLDDESRAVHGVAARNEARNCSILLDIIAAMNLSYRAEDIAVARRHLLRVMSKLPSIRKGGPRPA